MAGTVHDIVNRGGRCLIPVFALGRAQELLLILGRYWTYDLISTLGPVVERVDNSIHRFWVNMTGYVYDISPMHLKPFYRIVPVTPYDSI